MSRSPTDSEVSTESFAEREAHRLAAESKAIEELERAKAKPVAFAVRANYSFDSMMCTESVPLEGHMVTFNAKDCLHIKAPFNADWWIGRVVRIGCDLGFLPSPSKMMLLRFASNQQQSNNVTLDNDKGASGGEEVKGAGDEGLNANENDANENDANEDDAYDGPLGQFSSVRRGVPEEPYIDDNGHDMDMEGGYDSGGQGMDDSGDNDPTPANNKSSYTAAAKRPNLLSFNKTPSSNNQNQSNNTGGPSAFMDAMQAPKRKMRLRKADSLPPYEIVPCMRPVIFIGPALKGYEVTDMMQKALFENLKRRFEGRMFVTRVSADISQAKRNNQVTNEKKMLLLDRGRNRATTQMQVQKEVEKIFELASTMQLVVLDCDTINHPSQIVKTPLAPYIVYLKIHNLKVLSKLIKSRGKSQRKNASVQMATADKLLQCPMESFDLILEQSNLDAALNSVSDFLEAYWLATHPPNIQTKSDRSKSERVLGISDKLAKSPHPNGQTKRPMDATTVEMLTQLGPAGGANLLLNTGPTDPRVTEGLGGGGDQSLLLWGGEPEAYRSDREMRFDQQNRIVGGVELLPPPKVIPIGPAGVPPQVANMIATTSGSGSAPPVAAVPPQAVATNPAQAARPQVGIFGLVQQASRRNANATTSSGALRDPKNQAVYASRSARQLKARQEEQAAQQEEFQKLAQKRRNLARKQHREQQQGGGGGHG